MNNALLDPRGLRFNEPHNYLIKRSHRLVDCPVSGTFSLNEQRLMAYGLAKLPHTAATDTASLKVEVTAIEFGNAFNMNASARYRDLYDAYSRLCTRRLEWEQPAQGRRKARKVWANLLIGGSEEQDQGRRLAEGSVEMIFNPLLIPELLSKSRFILYRLGEVSVLGRGTAYRLYDIGRCLLPYEVNDLGRRGAKWSLEDFRELIGMQDERYPTFGDLNKYALRPAIDEINVRCFGLHLEIGPIKRGTRTTGVQMLARRKRPDEIEQVRAWRAENGLTNHIDQPPAWLGKAA